MTQVYSPFSGAVVPIEAVPDPVFSEKMLGDGLAIQPDLGLAVAPVDGQVVVFHSAGHAFAVRAGHSNVTVLVHIGLDTVKMKGAGFNPLVKVGDRVTVGQPLLEFDPEAIARAGFSMISPVLLPDLQEGTRIQKTGALRVVHGKDLLFTVLISEIEDTP